MSSDREAAWPPQTLQEVRCELQLDTPPQAHAAAPGIRLHLGEISSEVIAGGLSWSMVKFMEEAP